MYNFCDNGKNCQQEQAAREKNMKEQRTTYKNYAEARAKRSPVVKDCLSAFAVGGLICLAGQGLIALYTVLGANEETAGTLCSVTLIFLAALLTGLGLFDRIARFAGAGTLLPITGFANAMSSPAIDAKSEGWILGVGAKIFGVCGPVVLYGTLSSVLYGLIVMIVSLVS